MEWTGYAVVLRLESPLHVGSGKSGNLLACRPYVTGRTLWGALTARMARNSVEALRDYRSLGESVNEKIALTYFYPAVRQNGGYRVIWPWDSQAVDAVSGGRCATALDYQQGTAHPGALFEVEYITPHHIDQMEPVYLIGYLFSLPDAPKWEPALSRLQLGSERCYGWGRISLSSCEEFSLGSPTPIFEHKATVQAEPSDARPIVSLKADSQDPAYFLAHARSAQGPVVGDAVPLVTREWQTGGGRLSGPGKKVVYHGVYYAPGSRVYADERFMIGANGLWEPVEPIHGT